jgi:hypothetical protein
LKEKKTKLREEITHDTYFIKTRAKIKYYQCQGDYCGGILFPFAEVSLPVCFLLLMCMTTEGLPQL